ncbi:DedA family protein [Streptomyces sp. ST2-7A]|uniref:DedA family protein n=1 Tax=Streptomyces sp. ST2-7A TaxID=2907214 RepID=UPI001F1B9789|nr:VTT domain-containing protein [Streptomyces sp. ST2-7A]MCE7081640.1 VTT domain-containing protein [Streptomyces sp. ST2-7A]
MDTEAVTAAVTAAAGTAQEVARGVFGYPSLFLLVFIGALVPVVPTGAVVSSAAVVALHEGQPLWSSLLVLVVAAAGAFAGDALLFVLGRRGLESGGAGRWWHRLREQVTPELLDRSRRQLERRGATVLVLSRLVPAGRVPVLLACIMARMPLRDYLRGSVPAVLAWAATYQLIGLVGGAIFPSTWQAVAVAVGLAVLVTVVPRTGRFLVRRRRDRAGGTDSRGGVPKSPKSSETPGAPAGAETGTVGENR